MGKEPTVIILKNNKQETLSFHFTIFPPLHYYYCRTYRCFLPGKLMMVCTLLMHGELNIVFSWLQSWVQAQHTPWKIKALPYRSCGQNPCHLMYRFHASHAYRYDACSINHRGSWKAEQFANWIKVSLLFMEWSCYWNSFQYFITYLVLGPGKTFSTLHN